MRKQRKTLIKPLRLVGLMIGLYVVNCASMMCKLTIGDTSYTVYARDFKNPVTYDLGQMLFEQKDTILEGLSGPIMLEEPIVSEVTPTTIVLGAVEFRSASGNMITSREVEMNIDSLCEIYESYLESPEWDIDGKINMLSVLWEFLVNEQGVPAENAAGILGSLYCEGNFSQKEGTESYLSNIQQARDSLGAGTHGYGCAQWTYKTRQKMLLKYYEMANEMFPDDWERVRISAECAMLLEEVKGYDVFENIYLPTSIEDASGRMSCLYEKYDNYWKDWQKEGKLYILIRSSGSGARRLEYAQYIYDYFME